MTSWNLFKECHNRAIQKVAQYLGYPDSVLKKTAVDTFVVGLLVGLLLLAGNYFWPQSNFTLAWLFVLTMWALLHSKKSSTTWDRFDEIDERDLDFHNTIDKQLESFDERIKLLESKNS